MGIASQWCKTWPARVRAHRSRTDSSVYVTFLPQRRIVKRIEKSQEFFPLFRRRKTVENVTFQ